MLTKNFYLENSLQNLPQVLSWVDSDRYSKSYGCFDRLYWGWKLKDFPDATLQRAVFPLAILWQLENGPYFHSEYLLRIIRTGIKFWGKIQHKSGAVDQAFPNEHSYGASSFSLYSVIRAYKIIEQELSLSEKQEFATYFEKCAIFIVKANETHGFITNHIAGAAISLLEIYGLTKSERYLSTAKKLVKRILDHQSKEGWFVEYEGFDPGYQTLATYYLVHCWKTLQDDKLLESLNRSIKFLSFFIHPDGTIGGEYGSRNTEIFYPAGFELVRKEIPLAGGIADRIYQCLSDGRGISLNSMDPGNMIPLMTNYLLSFEANKRNTELIDNSIALPYKNWIGEKYFSNSNIYVKNTSNYYSIFGLSKGGVLLIFDNKSEKRIWHDGSYIGELAKGEFISSQMYSRNINVNMEKNFAEIKSAFYKVLRDIPTPSRFLLLRILNLSLMRNVRLGNFIKKQLVRLLISGKKSYPVILNRKVQFDNHKIIITDKLLKTKKYQLKWLHFGIPFKTIHMATSKYYSSKTFDGNNPKVINVKKFNADNIYEKITIININ